MKDQSRIKQELLKENAFLKQKIQELEHSESERKHADSALVESEERFRQLFEHIADGVAVYQGVDEGQDFVFVDINRMGQFLSKIRLDEAVGRRVTEVFPSVERMGLLDVFRRVWRTGQPEHHPLTEYADDRIVQWVENYVFKLLSGLIVVIYSDTTEKHRAEEALRQSEENFRHSLDDSPMGVRIVTEKGETVYANRRILNIYGYDSTEELNTTPVKKRYTLQSYTDFLVRRDKRQQGVDVPPEYEINIIRKDGEVRCLSVHRDEILWNGKKQFQVLYSDITEQKLAEEALREEAIRHRILIEQSRNGIVVLDQNGKVFEANRQFADLLGYSMEEVLQLHVWDWDTQWSRKQLLEMILTVNEAGDHFETRHRRKDGTFYDVEISTNGAIFGRQKLVFCVCRDITKRKRAEEALKESEERYRQLFENVPAGIYEIDLTKSRLLSANDVMCKYTGYTRDELLATNALDLLTGESQKLFMERMASLASGKPIPTTVEYQGKTKSGREFWMSLNSRYIYKEGFAVRAAVVAYDITKRKRAEEELNTSRMQLRALAVRLQKIREEERVMIAREIHDEMGGGLTGLKMDLSWLLRKMGDADPCEERVALMDKIHTSNALIDQMIHVVRRISTDLRPSVLDDLGLIAALEWQLSEFTSRTEIQHEFIKTFDYIYLEERTAVAVFRIFQEALTNIVRHSRATKVVVVLLEGERSLSGDESLVLEIRDNGRGITEEEILNKDSLGLLGMKERVLTFGGEVSIYGEPGGGTALILKIPRKK